MTDFNKTEEEARKAKWDADAAQTAALKAAREEAEATTPAAVARREAIAEKDAAAARREQVSALLPDFGKVERGSLELVKDGQPTAGTAVGGRALKRAAELVRDDVDDHLKGEWTMLVTSDADLAGSDAAYHSVNKAIDRLTSWADAELPQDGVQRDDAGLELALPVAALAGAAAQAVPGMLSLLSARRTVTTGTVTIDDLAASAEVAGVLKARNPSRKVFHDSVRTLPEGGLLAKVDTLYDKRKALIERKAALEASGGSAEEIKRVGAVGDAIEELLAALNVVPDGATRSPLAAAILREGIHDGAFEYVLLVKAQSASAMQMVDDKPFMVKDRFAVIAAASITWVLLKPPDGDLLDAGVTTGTAQANGKIGARFTFAEN